MLFSSALLWVGASCLLLQCTAAPPNFVFLLSESLDGRLLRPDSPARIPNIRALMASGSVRFDTAYSNNPVCAPSRSSLWSGRAPHRIPHLHNGIHVNGVWNNWEGLPDGYSERMDQILAAQAGYAVSLAGKTDWSIGGHSASCMLASLTFNVPWPYNITGAGGWNQEDSMCASDGPVLPGGSGGPEGSVYPGDWHTIATTTKFIATAAEPFFAFSGTDILHPPYGTNEYWFARTAPNITLPHWPSLDTLHPCDLQAAMKRGCTPGIDNASAYHAFYATARIERVRRVYLAALEEFDAMVGAVVESLHASGRAANTYIVLAADHGDMQLEHQMFYKMVPYDASARVPLVVASPLLQLAEERVVRQPVQLLDIFPTILSLAGAAVPAFADGHSLVPFLKGAASDPTRPGFVAYQNHDEDISMSWFAVTDGQYKLVQYGTGAEVPPQLFNLTEDPAELSNVFNATPAYVQVTAAMDARLRQLIDYPAVAMDVAAYQLQQFRWWAANGTGNWEKAIASPAIRWSAAWARHPQLALERVKAWMANDTVAVRACDGRMATVAPRADTSRADTPVTFSSRTDMPAASSVCVVTDYGAKGDNATDNSVRLQAVLDAGVARCQTIVFPAPGWFVTRALNFTGRSGRTIVIESGAAVVAWRDPQTYNTTRQYNALFWSDTSSLLQDVVFTGGGAVHGGGRAWWRFDRSHPRPHLFFLQFVANVTISNLTLIDSPSWNIGIRGSYILIENMHVVAGADSCDGYAGAPNTDGFNIGGSFIHVRDSVVHNGDDCIPTTLGPFGTDTHDVLVERINCSCGTNGGVVYNTQGTVRDVLFRDINVHGTNQGAGIKIGRAEQNATGGLVHNITWENIRILYPRNAALYTNVYYEDANQCNLPAIHNQTDWLTATNINFINIDAVVNSGQSQGCFLCSPANPCKDYTLQHVSIVDPKGNPAPPAVCINADVPGCKTG